MIARVYSAVLHGLEGHLVQVEVDVANGLPEFSIVGLPGSAVREARDRVRAALRNAGFAFPPQRITVNLAPADMRKEGPVFDLPIALGVLAATGQLHVKGIESWLIAGELALDGGVRPMRGALCMALAARAAGKERVLLPAENAAEARSVPGLQVCAVQTLAQAVIALQHGLLQPVEAGAATCAETAAAVTVPEDEPCGDLADVHGQEAAKRALEVAAAGGHNLLLMGPPGSGKTMLARRLPGVLPPLAEEEALEVSQVHSIAGTLPPGSGLLRRPPFRAPHHTASASALLGGGVPPRPGEVSLAHRGVLYLDELPEFHRDALEALRQPLEDAHVTVHRGGWAYRYPARLMLVASMNPCPCGFLGDTSRACTCPPAAIERYRQRLSGPLLDRIDLHVLVPRVPYRELSGARGRNSAEIRRRVVQARQRQLERYAGTGIFCNAELSGAALRRRCSLEPPAQALMEAAFERLGLSLRGHDRILRVARTIADLDGSDRIAPHHLAEAIQYRTLDRAAAAGSPAG